MPGLDLQPLCELARSTIGNPSLHVGPGDRSARRRGHDLRRWIQSWSGTGDRRPGPGDREDPDIRWCQVRLAADLPLPREHLAADGQHGELRDRCRRGPDRPAETRRHRRLDGPSLRGARRMARGEAARRPLLLRGARPVASDADRPGGDAGDRSRRKDALRDRILPGPPSRDRDLTSARHHDLPSGAGAAFGSRPIPAQRLRSDRCQSDRDESRW